MLAFPRMLTNAAIEAGMKTPENPDDFDHHEFPHFAVFCSAQLCRTMSSPNEHWDNAKVIVKIPDDKIKEITLEELLAKGLQFVF
jgi:hypothetical protein